jgi:hypothetical protein
VAVFALAAILIGGYGYLVSRDKIFWSDELFGWMLITDPSWTHMIWSWRAGLDGGGLGFYLLARLWVDVFGRTVLAFRAFSMMGCVAGLWCGWLVLRRYYRPEIAATVLFVVWFGSWTILAQGIQARFYGMILGATEDYGRTRRSTLAIVFAANLLLVSAHPFGALYSAAILFAAGVGDVIARRWRPSFYVASAVTWMVLLFSREAMRNSAKVGQPHFWTVTPLPKELLAMYMPAVFPAVGYLMLGAMAGALVWPERRRRLMKDVRPRYDVLIAGVVLTLVPVVVWVISQRGTSVFVDRYMIGMTLGVAVLGAEVLTVIFPDGFLGARLPVKMGGVGVAALLLFCFGWGSVREYRKTIDVPPMDFTGGLAAMLPRGVPVVFERVDVFDVMLAQQRAADLPMYFLLDWEDAVAPDSPLGMASQFHEMANWRSAGYFSGSILDADKFLSTAQEFVVVDDDIAHWFERRIVGNPTWEVERLGRYDNSLWSATIWKVRRKS